MRPSVGGKTKGAPADGQTSRAGFADSTVDERRGLSSTWPLPYPPCAAAGGATPPGVRFGVDSARRSVDKTGRFASTGRFWRPERAGLMRIEAVTTASCVHALAPLVSDRRMELHVDIDKLITRLAGALRQREERLLKELVERVIEHLDRTPSRSGVPTINERAEIMGIQLHALYPVSFVADRWDVSADNVRKKSEEQLPRADWKGGEIRYRGAHILQYEGVDLQEQLHKSSSQLEAERGSRSSEAQESNGRSSPPGEENDDGRPYNSELPALSDEDSSPD